jgi:hypothetical protein
VKKSWLPIALIACIVATLVHHVHNAQFLDEYPNMPGSLSPALVYLAWLGATAVGIAGYVLLRRGWQIAGCILLLAFGAYALDGLLHYTLAPLAAHSLAMNATIAAEAVTGTLLALAVVHRMVTR